VTISCYSSQVVSFLLPWQIRLTGLFPLRINLKLQVLQSVGLLWYVISPLQGHYLHRINADIHALNEIWTHYPSIWAGEDISWLRNHYDQHGSSIIQILPCPFCKGSLKETLSPFVPYCGFLRCMHCNHLTGKHFTWILYFSILLHLKSLMFVFYRP
jgi:hypothetical protein